MRIAQPELPQEFTSMPRRGAALMMMFRVSNRPDAASNVIDLLEVDGSGEDPGLNELWMLRYHPQNSSIECTMNGTVSVSSSVEKVRVAEWYIVECRLSDLDILTLRVNGDAGPQPTLPVYVYPVPSRTILLEEREVVVAHVRARVDVQIAAVVVHDEAFSDLEAAMIEEHMMDQVAEVYPDVPDACPGGPPPAECSVQSSRMSCSSLVLCYAVARARVNLCPSCVPCLHVKTSCGTLGRAACWPPLSALASRGAGVYSVWLGVPC